MEYNPSVFHRELQKNYGILPHSPTDFRRITNGVSDSNTDTRRYFTESCKKITGFCHIHRRIADGFSDAITDGITDGLSHACLTRVRLHEYRRHSRRLIPMTLPTDHACLTRVRLHKYRRHSRHLIPTALPTELPMD